VGNYRRRDTAAGSAGGRADSSRASSGEARMTDTPAPRVDPDPPTSDGSRLPKGTGRTRISTAWVGVIAGAVVLVLLLVFILQNTRSVKISYFTANGRMPLGVALLLATIGGLLLAGAVASLRIWQLRHRLAGHRRLVRGVDGKGLSQSTGRASGGAEGEGS
jgi:uncharacterized integral membrane protein